MIIHLWKQRAQRHLSDFRRSPWTEGLPLQAMAIGGLKLLGLPGEVFCGYGLTLRKKWSMLMTVGIANGDIGYLPTRRAYRTRSDYACYFAPKFFALFPFSPAIESILLRESGKILSSL